MLPYFILWIGFALLMIWTGASVVPSFLMGLVVAFLLAAANHREGGDA